MAAEKTGFITGETATSAPMEPIGSVGVKTDEKMPSPMATSATVPAIKGAFSTVIVACSAVGVPPVSPPLSSLLPPPHAAIIALPAARIKIFLSARFIAISHANQPDFRTAGTLKM